MTRNKEKARISRKKWKKNHREHHLLDHRICVHRLFAKKAGVLIDGTVTVRAIVELLKDQKGFCGICNRLMKEFEIDHKMPRSRGGTHSMSNIHLVCPKCNKIKGVKGLARF